MRILIEEYRYDVARVKNVLHGIDALENVEGQVSIHYVGYFFNTLLRDCVFILPKVLLKDVNGAGELAFGKYRPEDIVDLNHDGQGTPLEERMGDLGIPQQFVRVHLLLDVSTATAHANVGGKG